ncbi:MAG: RNA methyltransferase [Planctomycetota bacterium]
MPDMDLFASCLPGLEPLLEEEILRLGVPPRRLRGGVAFSGDLKTLFLAALRLGTASHLLLRCAEFHCRGLGELERKASKIPWARWLDPRLPRRVRAASAKSRLYHTGAIAERVARAVGSSIGDPGESESCIDIAVRFRDDRCTISIDTATSPLHRRGYRLETAKAPLREDLAHALLLAAGWKPGVPLLDPFCGSGTIAIEAAGLAEGLAPGRLRPRPLEGSILFDERLWREALAESTGPPTPGPIAAADRDAGAIKAARGNAERALVLHRIEFACCPFTSHPWLASEAPDGAVVVTNPPFGRRVRGGDLRHLHQSLGHRTRRAGIPLSLLSAEPRLARSTGVDLAVAFQTHHGGIRMAAMVPRGGKAVEAAG